MGLSPITFNSLDEYYELLEKLKNLDIQSEENLAKQLLIATDGNTYLINEMLKCSPEEAQSSNLLFIYKTGKKISVSQLIEDLQNGKEKLGNFVCNKPLAEILFTSMHSESQTRLVPNVPRCRISQQIIFFPVITIMSDVYSEHALKNWVAMSSKHPFNFELRLTLDDVFSNHALKQLLFLNIVLRQKTRTKTLRVLEATRNENRRAQMLEHIQGLDKDVKEIKMTFDLIRDSIQRIQDELGKKEQAYHTALNANPSLANKTGEELDGIQREFERKVRDRQRYNTFTMRTLAIILFLDIVASTTGSPVKVSDKTIGIIVGVEASIGLILTLALISIKGYQNYLTKKLNNLSGDINVIKNYEAQPNNGLVKQLDAITDYEKKLEPYITSEEPSQEKKALKEASTHFSFANLNLFSSCLTRGKETPTEHTPLLARSNGS